MAIWRMQILGTLVSARLEHGDTSELLQAAASRTYETPSGRRVRYEWRTLERWYYLYKRGGLDALEPQPRTDTGTCRAIPEATAKHLLAASAEASGAAIAMTRRHVHGVRVGAESSLPRADVDGPAGPGRGTDLAGFPGMTPSSASLLNLCIVASFLAGCPGNAGETGTTDGATTTGTTGSSSDGQVTTADVTTTTTEAGTTGFGTTGTGTTTGGTTTGGATTGGATTGGATTGGATTGDDIDFACEDTTGGDTTGGDTGDPVCTCILDDPAGGWGDAPSLPTCGEMLCPIVQADCVPYCGPESGPDGGLMLADPEALVCALTALRDRTPGIVRWSSTENLGQFSDDGYVLIRDDGIAIRRSWGAQDLCYVVGDARFGAMPDDCAFAQCLAASSALARFDCLRAFPLEPPGGQCDGGWSVEWL